MHNFVVGRKPDYVRREEHQCVFGANSEILFEFQCNERSSSHAESNTILYYVENEQRGNEVLRAVH